MNTNRTNSPPLSCRLAMLLIRVATTVLILAGYSRDQRAYERARSTDSGESWTLCMESHPTSAHVPEARERFEQLKLIRSVLPVLEGKDPVRQTKTILQLQKMERDAIPTELVPALITVLSDDTSVQIPENIMGADVRLNTQFGRGSVLRMQEGNMFPSDTGVFVAGKNAVLRVSTPGDEARKVLAIMAGNDLGPSATKWNEWWGQHQKNAAR